MSDQKSQDVAEIEGLLATRQQLRGWLDKLAANGARAPESVRTKVRADYQARLAQVVAQLGTHSDVIAATLDGLRAQVKEFSQLRQEETDVRAEAELRHTVGEYTDDEWQLVELESSGKIEGFDQELTRLADEIGRLEEVQSQIAPPSRSQAPQSGSIAREPEPELTVTHGTEIPPMPSPAEAPALSLVREEASPAPAPRPEAPRFVPRGGGNKNRESGPVRTIPAPQAQATATTAAPAAPQDELAFLRSVTLDAPAAARPEEKAAPSAAKTLKCGECGSLNRPTEWYCERCGAELAAV